MRVCRRTFLFFAAIVGCAAADVRITVLATTDLHGNLLPYDYYTAQPAERGLAKIATLIRGERSQNPNTLLIDCGDTIQGTPLEAVYQQRRDPALQRDPMMLAMNALGYDAMTVGNHEFNYGLVNLGEARALARFPWISANINVQPGAAVKPFEPYLLKTVAGVKIAVVGITTPLVPLWEQPEHYRGYEFSAGVTAAERAVAKLRAQEHPDIVIVAAHSGMERNPGMGPEAEENVAYQIATQVKGIDAVIFGHTHQQVASFDAGGVLMMQPKNWGISLGRMDFVLRREAGEAWKIVSKSSQVIPVTADMRADEEILRIAKPYHEAAERYLNTRVAEAPAALDARLARVQDTALLDAIQQVQLYYSKADVSFASSFNPRVEVPRGLVTVRQIAALYLYDNQLYTIEGTGKMVREALENAARYFLTCTGDCSQGPLVNRQVIGYNFDMAEGVDYEIDLRRPAGDRIRNLRWHNQPLRDDQPLRIAVNNYRAGGSAGYSMFRGARILSRSNDDIRDLVIRYYTEHKQLPAKPDGNWRIVPDTAAAELREEALAEARAPLRQ